MTEVILLTHKGCPVCPTAKQFWEDLRSKCEFEYKNVEIYTPEGLGFIKKFAIRSVPTTIIDGKVEFVGVPQKSIALNKIKCPNSTA
ncbi:MAG TPA: thioredoxin family protein [Candidatus Acidoferrales bacterium]|nr:thioredoxin family protein [Candidatus Acidoferrales bacterium]